jgi:phosphopantothenoylcysteine decarboxylase/phosphopantothenate--cysteine ligase
MRPALVIGFAAETDNVIAYAAKKLETKGCDWIVANDVSPEGGVFGGNRNTVHLITRSGVQSWPEMPKEEVAGRLMEAAAGWFQAAEPKDRLVSRRKAAR